MRQDESAYRQFIEDAGDMLGEHGLPHMAGRVVGALLISVPDHRSIDELAQELGASKGSISMATQLLLGLGVISKVSVPGERRHYYRVRPDIWSSLFTQRTEHLEQHRRFATEGLEILDGEPLETKMRLLAMLVFFDFVAEEAPGFSERWGARRDELMKRRRGEYA